MQTKLTMTFFMAKVDTFYHKYTVHAVPHIFLMHFKMNSSPLLWSLFYTPLNWLDIHGSTEPVAVEA